VARKLTVWKERWLEDTLLLIKYSYRELVVVKHPN